MTVVEMKKGSRGGHPIDPELAERAERARAFLNDYRSKHSEASWKSIARQIGGYKESTVSVFSGGNYSGSEMKIVEVPRWLIPPSSVRRGPTRSASSAQMPSGR